MTYLYLLIALADKLRDSPEGVLEKDMREATGYEQITINRGYRNLCAEDFMYITKTDAHPAKNLLHLTDAGKLLIEKMGKAPSAKKRKG